VDLYRQGRNELYYVQCYQCGQPNIEVQTNAMWELLYSKLLSASRVQCETSFGLLVETSHADEGLLTAAPGHSRQAQGRICSHLMCTGWVVFSLYHCHLPVAPSELSFKPWSYQRSLWLDASCLEPGMPVYCPAEGLRYRARWAEHSLWP